MHHHKKATKRDAAMGQARIAGYHGDKQTFTRLIVESHVASDTLYRAWGEGARAKTQGVRCTCKECEKR